MTAHLLIVEDDPDILDILATGLELGGYRVSTAATGQTALDALLRDEPDLVLLDVMLPDMHGFEVVRRLRQARLRTPVVFLTARDGIEDKIEGLGIGGDDYVTKPFNLGEVRARIRAVLRRTLDAAPTPARLVYADLKVDPETHEVWRQGRQVLLSPTEYRLLMYFLDRPGQVLSKQQILHDLWSYDFGGEVGIVESYVSMLRRKIDGRGVRLIHTLRGLGYTLREP
ncbi:response regulator transcription factor [Nonomuraea sp. NPDC050663]|uniref:response regulator transcription factor n=1 Tax=Nonomuraea sp. NPDC050663 TaxID=3364370 RepID=UPI00378C8DF1